MGDNADMVLDGYLDEYTGEYLGPGAMGFPRSRHRGNSAGTAENYLNTAMNFLRTRDYKTNDSRFDILKQYGATLEIPLNTPFAVARFIRSSKQNWKTFKSYIDNLKTT